LRIEGERSCRAFLKITSAMSEGRTFEAGMLRAGRQPTGLGRSCPVCTENLSSGVVMVKSTEDGVRFDTSDSLNFASDAVDAWRTPKRIFDAHPADQYAQLRVDLRSPSLGARLPTPVTAKAGPVPTHERLRPDDRENLQDKRKPAIQLDQEPAIMVRKPDATIQPTPHDIQLMSKHRVLSFKPQLRLEWRGEDGQNETKQPDHSASLGDSITASTRIRFHRRTKAMSSHGRLTTRRSNALLLSRLSGVAPRAEGIRRIHDASPVRSQPRVPEVGPHAPYHLPCAAGHRPNLASNLTWQVPPHRSTSLPAL
jgi:hypothetical protein